MLKKETSTTSGHRKRIRMRFAKNGFAGFQDYEVLEFLLFYIFRQQDTKPIAKRLLKRFGAFSNVIDASPEDIAKVQGMGKESALHLKALRNALMYYFHDHAQGKEIGFEKISELLKYLQAHIGGRKDEAMIVLYLNSSNGLIHSEIVSEGVVDAINVFPRKITEDALRHKATAVIIAHCHPGGNAKPSKQDIVFTEDIVLALSLVEITLVDHIIIAGKSWFSFKKESMI